MPGSHQRDTISGFIDVLRSTMHENVVGEPVEVRRHVRVAAAGPPQPIDADAGHLEERDLARFGGIREMSWIDSPARNVWRFVSESASVFSK